METKRIDLPFEIKELTDEGKFTGYASMYDEVDLGGDVVRPGAFKKTLQETKQVPILWQHDSREVIGMGQLKDTKEGLMIEGELDMEDPTATKAHRKLKRGMMRGLSIGFSTVKDQIMKSGIRELLEVKLWEVSVVTFPMLPSAQVVAVKQDPALTPEPGSTPPVEPPKPEAQAATKSNEPENFHSLLAEIQKLAKEL